MALRACLYLSQAWSESCKPLVGNQSFSFHSSTRMILKESMMTQGTHFHTFSPHQWTLKGLTMHTSCTLYGCLTNNITAQLRRWETSQAGGKCQSAVSPITESKQAVPRDTDLGHGCLSTHALSKSPIRLYRCMRFFVFLHMWERARVSFEKWGHVLEVRTHFWLVVTSPDSLRVKTF